MEYYGCKYI